MAARISAFCAAARSSETLPASTARSSPLWMRVAQATGQVVRSMISGLVDLTAALMFISL
jgi:hypothetical protein